MIVTSQHIVKVATDFTDNKNETPAMEKFNWINNPCNLWLNFIAMKSNK
jgi:hypothetical protein